MTQANYNYVNIAPPGVTQDWVTGINDASEVVGWAPNSTRFIYSSGTYKVLPFSFTILVTGDINDQGQVVGWGHLSGAGWNFGVIYSEGTWKGLFNYPGGNAGTEFSGVNDFGQIVGSVVGAYGNGNDRQPWFPLQRRHLHSSSLPFGGRHPRKRHQQWGPSRRLLQRQPLRCRAWFSLQRRQLHHPRRSIGYRRNLSYSYK